MWKISLQVLEFLAEKEILTVERVNGDSLHPGVERSEKVTSFIFFIQVPCWILMNGFFFCLYCSLV